MDVCAKAVPVGNAMKINEDYIPLLPRSFPIFSQLEDEEDNSVLLKGLEEDSFTVKSHKDEDCLAGSGSALRLQFKQSPNLRNI